MHDELVKALRCCVISKPCDACPYYDPNGTTKECTTMNIAAADAIEKLSMKLHGDEAAIAGMKREIERMVVADKPRWIPVTERLPKTRESILGKKSSKVIVAFRFDDGTQGTDTAHTLNGGWVFEDHITVVARTITHWMPLPEPPEEGET